MLSGDAPTIGAAKVMWVCKPCASTNASLNVNAFVSKEPLTHTFLKPARVGVRSDDIGAKRLEEARIPQMAVKRGSFKPRKPQSNPEAERAGQIKRSPRI